MEPASPAPSFDRSGRNAARPSAIKSFAHELVLVGLIAALLIWASRTAPGFAAVETQLELSTHVWEMALLAVPMTLIIISGGIDLSVGSLAALSAVVLGLAWEAGANIGLAAALGVIVGVAGGLLNGVFVAGLRVHPLIVTLATFSAYRGIAEGISLARPISGFPDEFSWVGRGFTRGFELPAWLPFIGGAAIPTGLPLQGMIFLVAAAAAGLLLARTATGRSIYAIGHNETACRFSGIPVGRIKMLLYALSGLASGVAAVMLVSRRNTAKADLAMQMELDAITAVVLGGTSIFGGRGRMIGTVLGVVLIHETRQYVSWRWSSDELNQIVVGGLLIGSVILHRLLSAR